MKKDNLKIIRKQLLALLCSFMLIQLSQPAAYAAALENDKIQDQDPYGEDYQNDINNETQTSEMIVVQEDKNVVIKEPVIIHESEQYADALEIVEKRSVNTRTYQLSEGHYATLFYFDDIFKEENGELVKIDNTLEKKASLFSLNDTQTYENRNGAFHFIVQDGVIMLENDEGDSIRIIPSGNLNNYAVKENVILYSSIYEQMDLEFRLSSHALSMSLMLNSPLAEHEYSFDIDTSLDYIETEDSIDFIKDKEVIFSLYRPMMYDLNYSFVRSGYELHEEEGLSVTMQMDEEWMAQEERLYPITAASTMEVGNMSDIGIKTSYIRSGTPNVTSTYEHLFIGYDLNEAYGGAGSNIKIARTFVYFPMPDIGENMVITNAALKLYRIATASGDNIDAWTTFEVLNTNYVNVDTVTWNNQPTNVSQVSDPKNVGGGGGYKSFDVTQHVRQLYAGENKTLIIKATNESANYHCSVFWSEKGSVLPALTIEYEDYSEELNTFGVEMHVYPADEIKISLDGVAIPNSTVLLDLYEKTESGALTKVKRITASASQENIESVYDRLNNPDDHSVNYSTALLSVLKEVPKKDTFYEFHVAVKFGSLISETLISDGFMWYTLQLGDNISSIARKYGISIEEIKEDNALSEQQLADLKEGDELFLRFKTDNPKVTLADYHPKPKISTYIAEYTGRGPSCSGSCTFGDPINTSTGNFYHESDDVVLQDYEELKFTRVYNSYGDAQEGMFGKGFTSNIEAFVAYDRNGNLLIFWHDGKIFKAPYANGAYTADSADEIVVTKKTDGHIEVYDQNDRKTYVFNTRGQLSMIMTAEGFKNQIDYDEWGRITTVMMGNKELTFGYNDVENGQNKVRKSFVDSITLPNQKTIRYVYNDKQQLIEVIDAKGKSEKYNYDVNGRIASITDKDGHTIAQNTYDNKGRVLTQIDGTGKSLAVSYNANQTQITYANGEIEKYEHNEDLRVEKITMADGSFKSFEYDERGDMISETDELNRKILYTYNEKHQLLKKINFDTTEITYTYDAKGNLLSKTDIDGKQELMSYDTSNRLISKTEGSGILTTMVYENGLLKSETTLINPKVRSGNEIVTTYEYAGSLISKKTRSDGYWVSYQYDAMGNMTKETDSNGRITYYTYDADSKLIQITDALGKSEQYAYDGRGNMVTYIDKLGGKTTYTYDGNNQLIKMQKGNTFTAYEYDERGRIIKESDEFGVKATYEYDGKGRKIRESDRYGKAIVYEYDAVGNITKITDALGNVKTKTYDNDLLIRESDEYGNLITYTYDENRRVTAVTNRYGTISYEYDENGNVTKIIDERGHITQRSYDEKNRLIEESDIKGVISEFTYDDFDNLLTKSVDDAVTSYTYDDYGNILSETDPLGNTKTYEYDALDRCIKETDAIGGVTLHEYDAMEHETKTTDALGYVERKVYNSSGALIQEIDKAGFGITYTYNAKDKLASMKDANDVITSYTYDTYGNLKTIKIGEKVIEEFQYDSYGRKSKDITPSKTMQYSYDAHGHIIQENNVTKGLTITKSYDSKGRLIKEVDSNDATTTYEYDSYDQLIKTTDALGRVTQNIYDSYGRKTETKYAGKTTSVMTYDKYDHLLSESDIYGKITSYTYDDLDRMITSTDPKGIITTITYDEGGRIINEHDSFSDSSDSYTYDACGNMLTKTDKLNNTVTYVYDAKGRVSRITDAAGHVSKKEYDIYDHVIKETDALGNFKQIQYNEFGLIIKETDERGFSVQYEYNAQLLVSKITDKLGNSSTYVYDTHNDMTFETNQNGFTTAYEYDVYGNIIKITDPRGNITTKEYNALNQIVKETIPNKITQYIYDEKGRLSEVKENDITIHVYSYDVYDQLSEEQDALSRVKTYTYDGYGNLIQTNESGFITQYTYDNRNREITKTENTDKLTVTEYDILDRTVKVTQNGHIKEKYTYDSLGNITGELIDGVEVRYTRDFLGRIITESYPIGETYQIIYAYEYDECGNMIRQSDALENVRQYEYNANGMMIKETDSNGAITKYEYDSLNNLTKVENALEKVVSYEYDGNSNLVKKNIYERSATYEYNANNYLIRETDEYGHVDSYTVDANGHVLTHTFNNGNTIASTYDLAGNKLSEGERIFTYDNFNRLLSAVYNEKSVVYTYDGYGNILKVKDANGKEISYEWDLYGNRTKVSYDNEVITYEYNNQEQMTVVKENGSIKAQYEYDQRGNIVKLTRGNIITQSVYDLLGRKESITTVNGSTTLASYAYTYDGENNVLTETIDGMENEYTYDALGELTSSRKYLNGQWKTTSYSYNLWGDKVVVSGNNENARYYYENGHVIKVGTKSISYDSRGNISKITYPNEEYEYFTYDIYGQLTKYTHVSQTVILNKTTKTTEEIIYEYDAQGERILSSRSVSSSSGGSGEIMSLGLGDLPIISSTAVEKYIVDKSYENAEILAVMNNNNVISEKNIYGKDERLFTNSNLYLNGLNNSVYGVAAGNASSATKIGYTDYGTVSGLYLGKYGYNGERKDENGLIYLRGRYYSPSLMQFIQIDSYKGEKESLLTQNRYSYCINNPYKYIDKGGHVAMANVGPDAGSGSKSGQPSSEKPSHSKGNASPRPANNDTTRASQKAKEAESKANNSRQPAAQQHPREPKGNKAENKGGEVEDPDPCSFLDDIAKITAWSALILGVIALGTTLLSMIAMSLAVGAPLVLSASAWAGLYSLFGTISTFAAQLTIKVAVGSLIASATEFVAILVDSTKSTNEKWRSIEEVFNNISIALAGMNLAYLANQFNPAPYNKSQSDVKLYDNWEQMKEDFKGQKGGVTGFIKENKPLGSPVPKNWFDEGGWIEIELAGDGTYTWKYYAPNGYYAIYVGGREGRIIFPREYLHPDDDIANIDIGEFTNRKEDNAKVLEYLKSKGYDGKPDGYVPHHDRNGNIQLVKEDVHKLFKHYGGCYYGN